MSEGQIPDAVAVAASESPRMLPFTAPLLVVVNGRASGVGDATATADATVAALARAGAAAVAAVTTSLDELADVLAGAAGGRVVLVGGDGAVHAVANLGIALPEVALVPAGRANNIARALSIPLDLDGAARVAVHGVARTIDALRVTTPERRIVAVEGVSAGFHAAARHRYRAENSAALGEGVRALAAELRTFSPYAGHVELDGREAFEPLLGQAFFANLPRFGFGFLVDPHARADDGLLEAVVLRARTRWDVVRLLVAARDGAHLARPGVTWRRAAEARLTTALPLVADAEPLGVTTARIDVLAGHLSMVGPAGPSPALAAPLPQVAA